MKNKDYTNIEKTGYTLVPNGILYSRKLSAKAMGVYYMIAAMPDEWNFTVKGLCALCSDGLASIRSAVAELEKAGFLKREGLINRSGKYTAGDWTITDSENETYENHTSEKQMYENQTYENQTFENRTQLNTKQSITNQSNTNLSSNSSYELFVVPQAKQRIVDAWNKAGLTGIKEIKAGSNRYKMLNARLKEYGEEKIIEAIEKAKASPFLKGQNRKGWVITFDWFLKPDNFIKVLEGNFDERKEFLISDLNHR